MNARMKILLVKVLFISNAPVGLLTNKGVNGCWLLVRRPATATESTDRLFDQKYVLRICAYLLSLRPLGLVPASGLLWLLSKSPKLILIDGATLVTAPKKGPSAGTSVRHMLQMPLLVADQQVVNGCWSGDQQR